MRVAWVLLGLVLSGCVSQPGPATQGPDPQTVQQPVATTLYLKPDYRLGAQAPTKPTPDRVAANPMVNGFANEDLRAFASPPLPQGLNITRVRLVAYYEVVAPSPDPFPNSSNPLQARQIVFWIGGNGTYPASVTTTGDTLLVPGRVYRAEAEIPLPRPGWIVLASEPIQLLVATLAVNDRGAELRFLVDSTQTPSRIEIEAMTDSSRPPASLRSDTSEHEIVANGGLFTGATADRVPSRARIPIDVRPNTTYLEVRVLFRSNAAGKSDLDFELFGPDGTIAASSSTPFQSETVRLFAPHLSRAGAGTYVADIAAYSGAGTRFALDIRSDAPR